MYSTVPFARVHVRISIFFVYVFCVCLSHVRCDRLDETTLQTVILYLIECTISFHLISFHLISFDFIWFHLISFDYITLQILLYIIIFCCILLYFITFCYILLYFIIFYYISLYFVTFYDILWYYIKLKSNNPYLPSQFFTKIFVSDFPRIRLSFKVSRAHKISRTYIRRTCPFREITNTEK